MTESTLTSLWSALVVRGPLESSVLPAVEASGTRVDARFDPTTVLMSDIEAGRVPDVLISTTASLQGVPEHLLDLSTVRPLISTAIGLGVAPGAPKPPIGTVSELVQTLRGARSVAYSKTGQSGIYFRELLDRLGIADEVDAKATVLPKGFTGEAVIDGRADLAVQQISELRFVPGVEIVGPLPDEVQRTTEFSYLLSVAARSNPHAVALYSALSTAGAAAAYTEVGLEPLFDATEER